MVPLHGAPHRIALTVQEHAHGTSSSITRDQEFVFPGDDHDIRAGIVIQKSRINLADRQNLGQRGIGQVDKGVCIARRDGGTEVGPDQSVGGGAGRQRYFLPDQLISAPWFDSLSQLASDCPLCRSRDPFGGPVRP